jgi:hypothetical protein
MELNQIELLKGTMKHTYAYVEVLVYVVQYLACVCPLSLENGGRYRCLAVLVSKE